MFLLQSGAQIIIKHAATNQNVAVEKDIPLHTFTGEVSTKIRGG